MLAGDSVADTLLVAGQNLDGMEVHDCQRLFTRTEIEQGSLGASPLVGLLVPGESILDVIDPENGTVLADIINYDTLSSRRYPELNIGNGLNCLWVRGNPVLNPDGTGWQAAIFQRPDGSECRDSIPTPDPSFVVRRYVVGQGPYPPTGRWMWNDSSKTQFVGIRCGQGWCELGRNVPQRPAGYQHSDSLPGWGDEQVLSYAPLTDTLRPKDPGRVRPSRLIGAIRRTEALKDFARTSQANVGQYIANADHAAEFFREPKAVAYVTLTGNDTEAERAYRLRHGFDRAAPTPIHFRTQRLKKLTFFQLFDLADTGPQYWLASIGPQDRFQVLWRTPHKHGPSGSVRWMWHDEDENAWIECDQGCCEIGPRNIW